MRVANTKSSSLVFSIVLLALSTSSVPAQDKALQDSLLHSVMSREIETVKGILRTHPEMASQHYGQGVPLLLFAAFAQEGGFIRPEDNELVKVIRKHIKSPGIFEACVTGDLDGARLYLEANPLLIDTAAASGWTLMHFAAFSGNTELVEYLYNKGGDINARAWRSSKIVPLLSGLLVKRHAMTKTLLELGADPLVRENGGFSAMHEAAALGDTANIRLLAEWGTELNSRRDDGDRPIDLARKRDHHAAVTLLVELGAEE